MEPRPAAPSPGAGPTVLGRRFGWRRPLAVAAGLLAVAWAVGLFRFAADIPHRVADPDTPTDAIVVLTGGSGRLGEGFALLAGKKARKLFISGVYRGVDVAELLRLSKQSPRKLECCVVLGYAADDTVSNANETAAWMRQEGYHSLRLVTSDYHMQRSLLEFRRAMPEATVIPNPVFPPAVKRQGWWHWPGTAHLIVGEYNKYLAALARYWLTEL